MSNIDYKSEVLKVHPNAQIKELTSNGTYCVWAFNLAKGYIVFNENAMTEIGAWYFAYEQLKKEGKIK